MQLAEGRLAQAWFQKDFGPQQRVNKSPMAPLNTQSAGYSSRDPNHKTHPKRNSNTNP